MPRYEFSEGASNKFWEITLSGTSFTTTYGRIGTDGQTSLKEFDSEDKAKKEYDKLIAEKTKKGYELVGGGGGASSPKAAPAPAAAKPAKKSAAVFDDEGEDEDEAPTAKPAKAAALAPAPAAKPAGGASRSGAGGARYFEFVEGTSSKFWEIELDGSSFTTRYGKIGTDGQKSLKEYASEALAQKEHDKLVAEKTKKGYVEK